MFLFVSSSHLSETREPPTWNIKLAEPWEVYMIVLKTSICSQNAWTDKVYSIWRVLSWQKVWQTKSDPRQKCIKNSDICLIRDSKFVVSAVGKLEKSFQNQQLLHEKKVDWWWCFRISHKFIWRSSNDICMHLSYSWRAWGQCIANPLLTCTYITRFNRDLYILIMVCYNPYITE